MRRSIRASRNRLLALGASILVSGSALAAAALPAQAAQAALPVAANAITVTKTPAGNQTTNPLSTAVSISVTATETVPAAILTFTTTNLPPGLTVGPPTVVGDATTVAITGTITTAGIYAVTVTATDNLTPANHNFVAFTWTANNTIAFPATTATQTTRVGTPVTGPTIAATDNDAAAKPLAYSAGATLPPGLTINSTTGVISGTPTTRGTYPVTVTATDQARAAKTTTFTWDVTANVITVKAKAPARAWVGVPVKVQATATDSAPGQTAQLTWTATGLPAGLTIGATSGLITGRPTAARAAVTSTLTARDTYGVTGTARVTFRISQGVVIPNPGAQATTVGQWKILVPIRATDGVPGERPSYSATGLPAGMGFQGSPMLLYGWPATPGIYRVTIHERGSLGSVSATTFKLTVRSVPARSAAGQIRLALDGKCLQDPGGRTVDGTRVRIETCAAGATEQWTVASDGTIRVDSRCLTVSGAGSYPGRQLQLFRCGRVSPRQLWTLGNRGELISTASGLCATDPGSSRGNGTVPVLGTCHVKSYEQWTLPAQPILTALGGYCADDYHSLGTIVDMFWCNATIGQDWTIGTDGTIRPGQYGNDCVTAHGRQAVIRTCGSAGRQKWTVVRTGRMSSELTQGGVCLAVPSLTSAQGTVLEPIGTQLVTSKCGAADPRDLWHIA